MFSTPTTASDTAEGRAPACFHCGLPVPAGCSFGLRVDGEWQSVCCPGCEAIAQAILDRGLQGYYRLRDADPAKPGELPDDAGDDLRLYDDPLVQSRFVRNVRPALGMGEAVAAGEAKGAWREAELLLEGMRCVACAWLVEQTLAGMPGVKRAQVIHANNRARIVWNPEETRLSVLLAAVRAVGYRAWPYERGRLELIEKGERSDALWRLFVAGFGMMQVMMYAVPVYLSDAGSMSADVEQLMRWAGFILTLPVMLYSAAPFFSGAWRDLKAMSPGMDVPVALGIAVAFGASTWSTVAVPGPVYFDSVAMFVFLLLGGRYLELLARQTAGRSLQRLARLIPETAHRLPDTAADAAEDGGINDSETGPVALIRPGDRVLVWPGEAIPADGDLESIAATVNEALLTGESRPVSRKAGETLTGGAVNAGSALVMRVTRVGADTVLSSITRRAECALAERPRWVEAAGRAASVFVLAILFCALAAGIVWQWIDPSRALWVAVSVLIVTCPCALSLATPVAMTVAIGEMARRGLVVARGHAVEALARATDCVFDKTGTLTQGRLALLEVRVVGGRSREECMALAAAIEQGSEHPVARALQGVAAGLTLPNASAFSSMHGGGVEAVISGRRYRVGNAAFVALLHGRTASLAWLHCTDTVVWLGDELGWLAAFRLGDGLRPESRRAVEALRGMGKRVHLLSGDAHGVALRTAAELGIDHVRGGETPAGKLAYVRDLQRAGACVAMVGDGVNDAPVLSQADVSVALAGGSDLAQVKADAVLLSDSPAAFADAVALAMRARTVMRQNLVWALAYNLIVLPLAFAGMVTPLIAGIGMSASSLVVVANALRLKSASARVSPETATTDDAKA